MNAVNRAALVLSIVIGVAPAYSQETSVPFTKIQRDAEVRALRAANDPGSALVPGTSSSTLPSDGLLPAPPVAPTRPRILDRSYLLLNGVHLAMALVDVEMTQHCMAEHKCREGNPIMPSSQAGQISVSLGFVTYTAVVGYWMKKHNMRIWWMAPTVGIAAHTAGAAASFKLR
jgi:hypothetical protein